MDALKYLPQLGNQSARLNQWCIDKLIEHKEYIKEHGQDMEEIRNWHFERPVEIID